MKKRKRLIDQRGQMIAAVVCLSFLLGTAGGALAANLLGTTEHSALAVFLQNALEIENTPAFLPIFWKYLKYDLIIWLGGWMSLGLFFSGAAFLFRSISVGFTSAMILSVQGTAGILTIAKEILPQNLFLIPAYILMMSAAAYYLSTWREGEGKRALKRERRRKQTEYCILFGFSILLLLAAAGLERAALIG